ncbi:MAG: S24/S26 family peptidase [Methanobacteriaceae archaeon]|nr:S24/S26 family peptidase [Methanobacteriaceae archaeon]MDO9626176.1 S24/S26 family peptidase [Methanobacteriaceae archaeon]
MNKKSGIIIGIIVLMLVAGSAILLNQHSNAVNIDIETNGSDITVATSTIPFNKAPSSMENEIGQYLADEIKSPDSTMNTITSGVTSISQKYNYTQVTVNLKSQFGENQLPMPAVVNGDSMYPTLNDGQSLMVLKTKNFKVGDIVISKHDKYGLIVKRVGKIEASRVYLMSDNKNVETIYETNYIITKTPLNTWVPRSYVVGVVKEY